MFPEFGQAPLSLELDLDSYDGSWTHVAAFRGKGGWLMAARATIQSEHNLMRATLLAACDEYENPIPAWRAEHLTTCDWSKLEDCRELPPDLLDDLLCEEEGAFFARWQRETNAELVALHDRAQHDLAALDMRLSAIQRQAGHEVAELQRRRRHPEASADHRAALAHLIARIEAESDAALVDATALRATLRREIDAAEEALWNRGDVLVEVEPMWCVRWQAAVMPRNRPAPRVGGNRPRVDGGKSVAAAGRIVASMIVEPPPKPRFLIEPLPQPCEKSVAPTRSSSPTTSRPPLYEELELRHKLAAVDRALDRPGRSTPVGRLRVQRAMLREELRRRGVALPDLTPTQAMLPEVMTAVEAAPSSVPVQAMQSPPRPIASEAPRLTRESAPAPPSADPRAAERRALQLQLDHLIAAGGRFRAGSPKFRRHQEAVAALRGRIAAFDGQLGGAPQEITHETLKADRDALTAELARHVRRGAQAGDGAKRFLIYAARRQGMVDRIARIDRQLGQCSPQPPVSGATRPSQAVIDALVADRAQLAADLDLHERSGVVDQNDARARTLFSARQAELAARLARADAKLARARALARTPE